jgi:hypothetical protein
MHVIQRSILLRLAAHGLLACFLANAANKFFVVDLDFEAVQGFYARIFAFAGDAPDQYRILPLLPLKLLCAHMPFNTAVLLYNLAFGWLGLELLWAVQPKAGEGRRTAVSVLFAGAYIYTQYTGWRPDTMGLFCLAALTVWVAWHVRDRLLREGALVLLVLALAFARADVALAFAAVLAAYHVRSMSLRLLLPVLPVAVQVLLQWVLFPEAAYYSKTVMLWDNLGGYYLLRNPATYLILALLLLYGRPLWAFTRQLWERYPIVCGALLAYLGLVLVIGRLNEYRLYLPFLPLLLAYWNEFRPRDEK